MNKGEENKGVKTHMAAQETSCTAGSKTHHTQQMSMAYEKACF